MHDQVPLKPGVTNSKATTVVVIGVISLALIYVYDNRTCPLKGGQRP